MYTHVQLVRALNCTNTQIEIYSMYALSVCMYAYGFVYIESKKSNKESPIAIVCV